MPVDSAGGASGGRSLDPGAGDGHRREYHAVTRGWIVNELFRRVDPAGRTIGEFLREDISAPLGVDAYIGLKLQEVTRYRMSTHPVEMDMYYSL